MKQLGWTSEKQSRELIKTGLSVETADMYIPQEDTVPRVLQLSLEEHHAYCPCWSLGRLEALLPKVVETKKPKNLYFPEILPASNGVAYTALNECKEMVFLKMFATGVESDATLIDNMVSMICWLLENNYIKK
jgi:hypothetical protein